MNPIALLEGVRVALALTAFSVALFGLENARQGELALPHVMRSRIRTRRRVQMGLTSVAVLALGAQSSYALFIPDAEIATTQVLTGNIASIIALVALLTSCFVHVGGWMRESAIMRVPLTPDAAERVDAVVVRAREIAHASQTALLLISGPLELLLSEGTLTSEQRVQTEAALSAVGTIESVIATLHDEIKTLARPMPALTLGGSGGSGGGVAPTSLGPPISEVRHE